MPWRTKAGHSRHCPTWTERSRSVSRNGLPLEVEQGQSLVVDPRQDVAARLGDMGDSRWGGVDTVAQQQVAWGDRDTPEGLAAVGVGHLEEVALQALQVDAEVEPPVGAHAAGYADGGGVDGTDAIAVGQRRRGMTLPQLVGHPVQPVLGGAKALEQRHGRDVTPAGDFGVGDGLLEGTAAGQVDQQRSQQDGGIGEASGSTQGTQEVRLLLPASREVLAHEGPSRPVLGGVHRGSSLNDTDLRTGSPSVKLTPMGMRGQPGQDFFSRQEGLRPRNAGIK